MADDSRNYQRQIQRKIQQNPTETNQSLSEFMAQVSVPKNHEMGPLLVKDLKKTFISFVSPNEQGYKVITTFITNQLFYN